MGWFFNCCSSSDDFMPLIQRFLLILFFCVPAILPNTSYASSTYDAIFYFWNPNNKPTAQESCNTIYAGGILANVTEAWAECHNPASYASVQMVRTVYGCQTGDTISGPNVPYGANYSYGPATCTTSRTCTAPEVMQSDGSCSAPPCVAGCTGACGSSYRIYGSSYPSSGCISGCNYKYGDGIQGSGVSYWVVSIGNNLGTSCTTPTPAPETGGDSPEYDCLKQGKSYGTVNGVVVCTALGSAGSAPATINDKSTSSTSTSDGTTSTNTTNETDTQTQYNPDGTVKTTSTSTTTNADGTTTTQTTSGEATKDAYCSQNPTSPVCQQKTDCDKFPDSVGCKDTDDFIKAFIGDDKNLAEENLSESTINMATAFNPQTMVNDNTCPPPLSLTIAGSQIVVSFDTACSYASAFKPLVIGFALLVALGLVANPLKT